MRSSNPYSGIYRADTAKTLDITGGRPTCNQGGMLVLFDNHSQDSRYNGPLKRSPSLNTQLGTGGNNAPLVCVPDTEVISLAGKPCPPVVNADWRVRMITPLECARLQGFPDWWTDGLTDENPSDEEVRKWQGIFDEWCDINGKKHKSPAQVKKWLQAEHPDSAKYKLWGNGVALPCVVFVLCGIVAITENQENQVNV